MECTSPTIDTQNVPKKNKKYVFFLHKCQKFSPFEGEILAPQVFSLRGLVGLAPGHCRVWPSGLGPKRKLQKVTFGDLQTFTPSQISKVSWPARGLEATRVGVAHLSMRGAWRR